MMSGGDQIVDAVGWILQHPQQLFIQVGAKEKNTEGFDVMEWLSGPQDISEGDALPNLAGVASGGFAGLQDWGYTVGQLSGRSPSCSSGRRTGAVDSCRPSTAIQTALLFYLFSICLDRICRGRFKTHGRFLDSDS